MSLVQYDKILSKFGQQQLIMVNVYVTVHMVLTSQKWENILNEQKGGYATFLTIAAQLSPRLSLNTIIKICAIFPLQRLKFREWGLAKYKM